MSAIKAAIVRGVTSLFPRANLAKGPKSAHWFLGEIKPFHSDPLKYMLRVAQYPSSLVRLRFLSRNYLLINHPDLVRDVLVTKSDDFVKYKRDRLILGRVLGGGLVTSEGLLHKSQRRLLQPASQNRRIESYAPLMVASCREMLADWEHGSHRRVNLDMNRLTMGVAVKTLFDVELSNDDYSIGRAIGRLQELAMIELMRIVPRPLWWPSKSNNEFKKEKIALDSVIVRIIDERRTAGTDRGDLLSALLHSADSGGMSDQQLRDELVTLFAAGHETTANAMSWTWALLSENPAAEKSLHQELQAVLGGREPTVDDLADLPFTEAVFKESLRLKPPVWMLSARQAVRATTLGGFDVPRASLVFISPYTLHRDEKFFPNASQFLPERWLNTSKEKLPRLAFLPFGAGHRVCIGHQFSLQEGVLLIATIAQRYSLRLRQGGEVAAQATITLGPAEPMTMEITRRG